MALAGIGMPARHNAATELSKPPPHRHEQHLLGEQAVEGCLSGIAAAPDRSGPSSTFGCGSGSSPIAPSRSIKDVDTLPLRRRPGSSSGGGCRTILNPKADFLCVDWRSLRVLRRDR